MLFRSMGNYYELEKASRDDSQLKAFMFFNEKENIGFILVFCPENCTRTEYRAVLQGLKEDDFRSVNGQIEYLLTECVRQRKKNGKYVGEEIDVPPELDLK